MAYNTSAFSSAACTVPDCRRARRGKSLASTLDLVNSKPTTPGVEGEASTEDTKAKSVAAVRRVDRKLIVPDTMAQDLAGAYAGRVSTAEAKILTT